MIPQDQVAGVKGQQFIFLVRVKGQVFLLPVEHPHHNIPLAFRHDARIDIEDGGISIKLGQDGKVQLDGYSQPVKVKEPVVRSHGTAEQFHGPVSFCKNVGTVGVQSLDDISSLSALAVAAAFRLAEIAPKNQVDPVIRIGFFVVIDFQHTPSSLSATSYPLTRTSLPPSMVRR